MKKVTSNLMLAAAAIAAVGGMASAQTMEAKIPFAFRAGDKVLAAGTYRVRLQSQITGSELIVLSTKADGAQAVAAGFASGDLKKEWAEAGDAVLTFQCGAGRCALREVWSGNTGAPVYRLPVRSLGKDEPSHVAAIVMVRVKGE